MIFHSAFVNSRVEIDLDYSSVNEVAMLITDKVTRVCIRMRYVRVGDVWRPIAGQPLDDALTHVLNHYSNVFYMEELVNDRSMLEKDITKITKQEFELHMVRQVNSFARQKG